MATDYSKFLPKSGSRVVFTEVPRGSYATVGHEYEVTYAKHQRRGVKGIFSTTSIRLWDHARDCGTFDSALMWTFAKWAEVNAG